MTKNYLETKATLADIYLPRWSQMLVWGQSVEPSQAKDIILRTDQFLTTLSPYGGGNNRAWKGWARGVLGYDLIPDDSYALQSEVEKEVHRILGVVTTTYVTNRWASSSYIHGPHGWCHPDGAIWYSDNVGKEPSALEVWEDWMKLAEAFPYLDLTVTLMSGEYCEDDIYPVFSLRVRQGAVSLLEKPELPPEDYPMPRRNAESPWTTHLSRSSEQGLPNEWIYDFGGRIMPIVQANVGEARQRLHERGVGDFTFAQWKSQFKPTAHPKEAVEGTFGWGYGSSDYDRSYINGKYEADPKRLWSLLEDPASKQRRLVPGFVFRDAVARVVCQEPHDRDDITVFIHE